MAEFLAIGGQTNNFEPTNIMETYNPSLNNSSWNVTSILPNGIYGHTSTLLTDGTVLIIGSNFSCIWNPANNSFEALIYHNLTRYYHTATLLQNGHVLITGGTDLNSTVYNEAEIFSNEFKNMDIYTSFAYSSFWCVGEFVFFFKSN